MIYCFKLCFSKIYIASLAQYCRGDYFIHEYRGNLCGYFGSTSESGIPQVMYIYNLSTGLKTFQVLLKKFSMKLETYFKDLSTTFFKFVKISFKFFFCQLESLICHNSDE